MNASKRKGDRAELEVQGWFSDILGVPARRALGAGRKDDVGDIHGVPDTAIQVANYADLDRAVREKLPLLERQRDNAGAQFAAMFCRRRGGSYVVVMTPEQFAALWQEAQPMPVPDNVAALWPAKPGAGGTLTLADAEDRSVKGRTL